MITQAGRYKILPGLFDFYSNSLITLKKLPLGVFKDKKIF
ncbi:hypothetical protein PRUB_b0470 [Pseudoalteromonas rubra]|uniref:Uncharacterized protein n=1 Tax=Pseudoalteromonas rubra TaxID=43658 RepID=A0A8T0BZR7_9GAMM|nr:hypothetical protein PRUB_b0470 [Pseudoalteromonas rubra]